MVIWQFADYLTRFSVVSSVSWRFAECCRSKTGCCVSGRKHCKCLFMVDEYNFMQQPSFKMSEKRRMCQTHNLLPNRWSNCFYISSSLVQGHGSDCYASVDSKCFKSSICFWHNILNWTELCVNYLSFLVFSQIVF